MICWRRITIFRIKSVQRRRIEKKQFETDFECRVGCERYTYRGDANFTTTNELRFDNANNSCYVNHAGEFIHFTSGLLRKKM